MWFQFQLADTMNAALGFEIPIVANSILTAFVTITRVKEQSHFMEAEETLVTGLRGLDPQTITKIHEAYFPSVYRYAHYRVGDATVAEDLSSETFIRLLEAVYAGKGPKSSLRGWLMGTVSNLVNDYFRQIYNKSNEVLNDGLKATQGDPELISEQRARQETLRLGLSKLTQDQQHVLALRFGSGCSLAETAEIIGKKPNAIKQLQFRALAALRKQIEAEI
jgi:RNA polymerase sigma-70 factor, ECF subfamily